MIWLRLEHHLISPFSFLHYTPAVMACLLFHKHAKPFSIFWTLHSGFPGSPFSSSYVAISSSPFRSQLIRHLLREIFTHHLAYVFPLRYPSPGVYCCHSTYYNLRISFIYFFTTYCNTTECPRGKGPCLTYLLINHSTQSSVWLITDIRKHLCWALRKWHGRLIFQENWPG